MILQKNNKMNIFIDIGTHKGQELNFLFYSNKLSILLAIIKGCLRNCIVERKKPLLINIFIMFKKLDHLRSISKNKEVIAVEPNVNLLSNKIYKLCDIVFNLSLSSSKNLSIQKLFFANNDIEGQGSSLYINKKNVSEKNYMNTVVLNGDYFFELLKRFLDERYVDYKIFLRINNEGEEFNTIKSCLKVFDEKVYFIGGSLKDSIVLHSQNEYRELLDILEKNNINFIDFSGDYKTWPVAITALSEVI